MKELTLEGLLKAVKYSPQDAYLVDLSGQALADVRCKQKTPLEYTDCRWIEENQRLGYPIPIDACMFVNASNNSLLNETFDQRFLRFFPNVWWFNIANNPVLSKAGENFPRGLGKLDIRGTKFSKSTALTLSNTHIIHLVEDMKLDDFQTEKAKREYLVANLPFVWCINGEFVSAVEQQRSRSLRNNSNAFLSPPSFNNRTMNDREKSLIYLNQNIPGSPLLSDSVRLDVILEDYLNEAEVFNDYGLKRLKINQLHSSVPKMPFVSMNRIFDLPRRLKIDLVTILAVSVLFEIPSKLFVSALENMFSTTLPDGKNTLQYFTSKELQEIVDIPSLVKTAIINLVRRLLCREILEIDTIGGKLSRPILDPKNSELTRHLDLNSNCGFEFKSDLDEYTPLVSINNCIVRNDFQGRRNKSIATCASGYDFCHLRMSKNYLERPQYVARSDMYIEYSEGSLSDFDMEIVKYLPPVVTKSLFSFIYPGHVLQPGERERKNDKYAISFLCRHVILLIKKSKLCPTLVRAQTTLAGQKYYNDLLPLLQCGSMTYEDLGIEFSGVTSSFNDNANTSAAAANSNNNSNSNNNTAQEGGAQPLDGDMLVNLRRDGRVYIRTKSEVINTAVKGSAGKKDSGIDKVLFGGKALGFGCGLPKGIPGDLFWNSTQVPSVYMRNAFPDFNDTSNKNVTHNRATTTTISAAIAAARGLLDDNISEDPTCVTDTLTFKESLPPNLDAVKETNDDFPAMTDTAGDVAGSNDEVIGPEEVKNQEALEAVALAQYESSFSIQKSSLEQLGNFHLSQEIVDKEPSSHQKVAIVEERQPHYFSSKKRSIHIPSLKSVKIFTEELNSKPSFVVGSADVFNENGGVIAAKSGGNVNSRPSSPEKKWTDLTEPLVFVHPSMPKNIVDCEVKTYVQDFNLQHAVINLNEEDAQLKFYRESDMESSADHAANMELQARLNRLKKIKYKLNTFGFDSLSHYQFFLNLSLRLKKQDHPLAHVLYKSKGKTDHIRRNLHHHIAPSKTAKEYDGNHIAISEELLIETLTGDEGSELDMRSKIDSMLSFQRDDVDLESETGYGDARNRVNVASKVDKSDNIHPDSNNSDPNGVVDHSTSKLNFPQGTGSDLTDGNSLAAQRRLMLEMGTLKNYRNLNQFNDKAFRTSKSAPNKSDGQTLLLSKSTNWISSIKLQSKVNKSMEGQLLNDATFLTNENQYYEPQLDNFDDENKAEFYESRMSSYANPDPTRPMSSTHFLKAYHNYSNIKILNEDTSVIPPVKSITDKVITPLWTEIPSKVTYVLSKESSVSNQSRGRKNSSRDSDDISVSESIMADFNSPIVMLSNSNIDNFPIYNFDAKTTKQRPNDGLETSSSSRNQIIAQGQQLLLNHDAYGAYTDNISEFRHNDPPIESLVTNLKIATSSGDSSVYGTFMPVDPMDNIEGKIPKGDIYAAVYDGRSNRGPIHGAPGFSSVEKELTDRVHHSKNVSLPVLVKSSSDSKFMLASAQNKVNKNNNELIVNTRSVGIKDGVTLTKGRINTVSLSQKVINPNVAKSGILVFFDNGNCDLLPNEVESSQQGTSTEKEALMNRKFPYISKQKGLDNIKCFVNPYANKPSSYKYLSAQENFQVKEAIKLEKSFLSSMADSYVSFPPNEEVKGTEKEKDGTGYVGKHEPTASQYKKRSTPSNSRPGSAAGIVGSPQQGLKERPVSRSKTPIDVLVSQAEQLAASEDPDDLISNPADEGANYPVDTNIAERQLSSAERRDMKHRDHVKNIDLDNTDIVDDEISFL